MLPTHYAHKHKRNVHGEGYGNDNYVCNKSLSVIKAYTHCVTLEDVKKFITVYETKGIERFLLVATRARTHVVIFTDAKTISPSIINTPTIITFCPIKIN